MQSNDAAGRGSGLGDVHEAGLEKEREESSNRNWAEYGSFSDIDIAGSKRFNFTSVIDQTEYNPIGCGRCLSDATRRRMPKRLGRRGFTLIELLMVMAIISVLAALL